MRRQLRLKTGQLAILLQQIKDGITGKLIEKILWKNSIANSVETWDGKSN